MSQSTANVTWNRGLDLECHSEHWRSLGSTSGPLVYKSSARATRPRRLLFTDEGILLHAATKYTVDKFIFNYATFCVA